MGSSTFPRCLTIYCFTYASTEAVFSKRRMEQKDNLRFPVAELFKLCLLLLTRRIHKQVSTDFPQSRATNTILHLKPQESETDNCSLMEFPLHPGLRPCPYSAGLLCGYLVTIPLVSTFLIYTRKLCFD